MLTEVIPPRRERYVSPRLGRTVPKRVRKSRSRSPEARKERERERKREKQRRKRRRAAAQKRKAQLDRKAPQKSKTPEKPNVPKWRPISENHANKQPTPGKTQERDETPDKDEPQVSGIMHFYYDTCLWADRF